MNEHECQCPEHDCTRMVPCVDDACTSGPYKYDPHTCNECNDGSAVCAVVGRCEGDCGAHGHGSEA